MKEITNIKTGKSEIVTDEIWQSIIARRWDSKFTVVEVPTRDLNPPRIIEAEKPIEIKTKTKKKNG
jgi:hypothetical protein